MENNTTNLIGQDVIFTQPQLDHGKVQFLVSKTESIARSQSSSFDESITGEKSSYQHPLKKTIQFPRHEPYFGDTTPATSLSIPSSQEHQLEDLQDVHHNSSSIDDGDSSDPRLQSRLPGHQDPCQPNAMDSTRNAPYKRMADGNVKSIDSNLPGSPADVDLHWHTRDSSANNNSSPISELSDQLRTRLSYAMLKIQNGWQSRSLDELESLSQHCSPISAGAEYQRVNESRPKGVRMQSSASSHSAATSEPTQKEYTVHIGAHNLLNSPPDISTTDSSLESRQAGRTYESFWREHSTNSVFKQMQTQDQSSGRPSLAPPVDIVPRNRRRLNTLKTPPRLRTDAARKPLHEHVSNPNVSNLVTSSATPQTLHSIRSANQNAAMEKDAVETLIFMSSPGNSNNYSSTSTTDPQSRNELIHPEKRVGFAAKVNSEDFDDHDLPTTQAFSMSRGLFNGKGAVSEADVDRILDEMSDGESSSEEDDNLMA